MSPPQVDCLIEKLKRSLLILLLETVSFEKKVRILEKNVKILEKR